MIRRRRLRELAAYEILEGIRKMCKTRKIRFQMSIFIVSENVNRHRR